MRIIFDRYNPKLLKSSKFRNKRIYLICRNKNYLTEYLSKNLQKVLNVNFAVVFGTTALMNMASFNPNLLIHNKEEADTGIVLHALDFCKSDSFLQVVVSCPNTNVSLLLLNYFDVLNS